MFRVEAPEAQVREIRGSVQIALYVETWLGTFGSHSQREPCERSGWCSDGGRVRIARGLFWWSATILVLVVLDDLVFGPIFWSIALLSLPLAIALAFLASWAFGTWLVFRGTRAEPGRIARFFLNRLWLERRNPDIARRERKVRQSVTSGVAATIATPFIGGVIPCLVLHKRDAMPVAQIRRLAVFLAALYAVEFSAIHGYGFGRLIRSVLGGFA